jgi:hypothetical protein
VPGGEDGSGDAPLAGDKAAAAAVAGWFGPRVDSADADLGADAAGPAAGE